MNRIYKQMYRYDKDQLRHECEFYGIKVDRRWLKPQLVRIVEQAKSCLEDMNLPSGPGAYGIRSMRPSETDWEEFYIKRMIVRSKLADTEFMRRLNKTFPVPDRRD